MDIFCPACQKKLQIADSAAGQAVKCPYCAATFAAPALPGAAPMPAPEPIAPPGPELPPPGVPFNFAPDHRETLPTPPTPPFERGAESATPADTGYAKPQAGGSGRPGDYSREFTIHFRGHVVAMIAPVGMIVLFILSFLSWRFAELTMTNPVFELQPNMPVATITTLNPLVGINLWGLAFTREGSATFTFYVILMILAGIAFVLSPLFAGKLLPTPPALKPYLPWLPGLAAVLILAAWLLFLAHYVHCVFIAPLDPATLWMKLAFRIHTLVVIGAWLDVWLERRQLLQLPEPHMRMRW